MAHEKIETEFEKFYNDKLDFTDKITVPFGEEGGTLTRGLNVQELAKQDDANRSKIRNEINRIIKENPDNADEIKKALLNKLPSNYKDRIFE